jgi:hypothetical protein
MRLWHDRFGLGLPIDIANQYSKEVRRYLLRLGRLRRLGRQVPSYDGLAQRLRLVC